ncbi:MAG: hypothetical protein KBS55_01535 [Bacteroidales bacterium]|nr:hypothetical protein [Candidatus Cryptobacteroides aphodequi]
MKQTTLPLVGSFADIQKFSTIAIDCVPWKEEYPYKPEVSAALAHTDKAILVRFSVRQNALRAVCTEANGHVWEDDCVEFFVKAPGSPFYCNFETNCLGVGLSAIRRSREDFKHFDAAKHALVLRRSSLPAEPVDKTGDCAWTLELEVPFAVLDCPEKPETLLANFYKCGDGTATPHFVSWNPIGTAKPDFHCPEYFGELKLEW